MTFDEWFDIAVIDPKGTVLREDAEKIWNAALALAGPQRPCDLYSHQSTKTLFVSPVAYAEIEQALRDGGFASGEHGFIGHAHVRFNGAFVMDTSRRHARRENIHRGKFLVKVTPR